MTKKYPNGTLALNDVSLRIADGEFVFIVGSSGAGKSTLIKLMLREERATSGVIKVNGKNLGKMPRYKIPKFRRSIGVVFQDFRLIPNMTAYDNVAFALRVTNVSSKEIKRKVPYMLSLVGLANKAKCKPDELSGGEQQRVALARALMCRPEIVFADEPTGNLDALTGSEILKLLFELNDAPLACVMVTHSAEAAARCNRKLTLDKGRIS